MFRFDITNRRTVDFKYMGKIHNDLNVICLAQCLMIHLMSYSHYTNNMSPENVVCSPGANHLKPTQSNPKDVETLFYSLHQR